MRLIALTIALTGLILLSILIFVLPPHPIESQKELSKFPPNQKVIFTGKVVKTSQTKITLDNNLSAYASLPNHQKLLPNKVQIIGIVEEFPPGKKQINALSLRYFP